CLYLLEARVGPVQTVDQRNLEGSVFKFPAEHVAPDWICRRGLRRRSWQPVLPQDFWWCDKRIDPLFLQLLRLFVVDDGRRQCDLLRALPLSECSPERHSRNRCCRALQECSAVHVRRLSHQVRDSRIEFSAGSRQCVSVAPRNGWAAIVQQVAEDLV